MYENGVEDRKMPSKWHKEKPLKGWNEKM